MAAERLRSGCHAAQSAAVSVRRARRAASPRGLPQTVDFGRDRRIGQAGDWKASLAGGPIRCSAASIGPPDGGPGTRWYRPMKSASPWGCAFPRTAACASGCGRRLASPLYESVTVDHGMGNGRL